MICRERDRRWVGKQERESWDKDMREREREISIFVWSQQNV